MSQWQIIIPVKQFSRGKSRIQDQRRDQYARAFAMDTITAAAQCGLVNRVVVVTDEASLKESDFDAAIARKLAFLREAPDGLNPAIRYAVARLGHTRPDERIGVLLGDLPALRASDLGDALYAATEHERAFVRDAEGTGTTLLMAAKPSLLIPAFGGGSAQQHEELGYTELTGSFGHLARDVDTAQDLARLKPQLLGRHTGALVGNTAAFATSASR